MAYASLSALKDALSPVVHIREQRLVINDVALFRETLLDELVHSVVFGGAEVREAGLWIIWAASQALGCGAASLQGLCKAIYRGEISGFTIPVINIPSLTYQAAGTLIKAAKARDCAAMVFEIRPAEIGDIGLGPAEYSACVLGAALKEDWDLPVLLQLSGSFAGTSRPIETLVEEAVRYGFFNIDLGGDREEASLETMRRLAPEGIEIAVVSGLGGVSNCEGLAMDRAVLEGFPKMISDDPDCPPALLERLFDRFQAAIEKLAVDMTGDVVRRHIIPVSVSQPKPPLF